MSLENIHLRKLLQMFYSPDGKRTAALRADIRDEIRKRNGDDSGGGDFHTPFWTDAKSHVVGEVDLRIQMKARIDSNGRRKRLYPQLTDGFLSWWNERRRWKNEPFELIPARVKARFRIPELGAVVKIENMLAVKIGGQSNRIVYPYFAEEPSLSDEGGRIGLWVLDQALAAYELEELRILDVIRSASFGVVDFPLRGDERDMFLRRYESALMEWRKLWEEYP
jgi:hypothetical protein